MTGDRHLDEDACLDLAHGLLRPEEEQPILAHLRSCASCREMLRAAAGRRERLRAAVVLDRRRRRSRTNPARAWWRWGLVPAGAMAAAAVFLFALHVRGPEDRAASPYHWLPEVSETQLTRRVGSTTAGPELLAGLAAYARHDAEAAVRQLERASASGPLEALRLAYLGSALALAGRPEDSVTVLSTVRAESLPEPWRSETRWTLAMAWRESGLAPRADSLLSLLKTEPGTVGERARALR